MRFHRTAVVLMALITLVGCASIMPPDPSTKSPAEQQQDRNECAAAAARAAQDYAWSPLADLAAIRADREAECLESRGYVTTTRVTMRPSPEGGQPAHTQSDPVRGCFQQAYAWLGRYDGPIDGRPNVRWMAAQQAYLTEYQIMSSHPDTLQLVRATLQRDLQAVGRADEWRVCLEEATKPQSNPPSPSGGGRGEGQRNAGRAFAGATLPYTGVKTATEKSRAEWDIGLLVGIIA